MRAARWLVLLFALSMISFAQEHGATKEAGKETTHGELSERPADTDMTAWKWANFAILAAALGFLIVKNAGPYFVSRSIEIRKGIEEAQKLRADAEASAAEITARLANIGADIEAMRKTARDEAAQEGARIRQETEREMAKVQAHASHEISTALKAAQIELKTHAAQLALDLARKKVRERMTPADEDSLIHSFVDDLSTKLEQGTTP
jgi:F-type H+-transporting ATPase subunit b